MKVLLTTCLLFALLSTVASLLCYACAGDEEACLHPTVIVCEEDEDRCANLANAVNVGDLRIMTFFIKTCVQSQYWHTGNQSIATTHDISVIGKGEICQKDLCNRKTITLPHRSQLPENGRKCPACLTFNADSCQGIDVVSCRGNETKCIHFGVVNKGPEDTELPLAFRGCVTPPSCNYPEGEREGAGGVITANVTHLRCRDAPRSESALEGYVKASQLLLNLPFMGMKLRDEGVGN